MLTVGSLFAGIGGLDLGLERTGGFKTVWQVEIDSYARRVLEKHWPHVRRHDDVKTFPPTAPEEWGCDVIAGGFPCQPVSLAGRGLAQDDDRWLWPQFARVLRLLRPRYALLENVAGLLVRGFGDVLGDLADLGFDAEWAVLPASAFGACHIRPRVFIVAYSQCGRRDRLHERQQEGCLAPDIEHGGPAGANGRPAVDPAQTDGADSFRQSVRLRGCSEDAGAQGATEEEAHQRQRIWPDAWSVDGIDGGWATEPDVGRVVDGLPHQLDRNRALGNAVVPQVAEWIGRRILASLENH